MFINLLLTGTNREFEIIVFVQEAKRLALEHAAQDQNLLDRLSLTGSGVQLLPELESDVTSVKLMRLSGGKNFVVVFYCEYSKDIQTRSPSCHLRLRE